MTHACATGRHPEPTRGCFAHHGCRCEGCVEANRAYFAGYRALRREMAGEPGGLIDAAPTVALVRWLIDAGATHEWITDEAGVGRGNVSPLRHGECTHVRVGTHERIASLAGRVARGEIQPPRFREAQRLRMQREKRRQYRVPAMTAHPACGDRWYALDPLTDRKGTP